MIKDLRANYRPISDYTMACIAECMDDELREQVHFDCAPCTNEQFITEYARRLVGYQEDEFANFLSDNMNLDLDDIIFTAYCERYDNELVTYDDIEWLKTDCPYTINVEPLCATSKYDDSTVYLVSMVSGDFIVYANFNAGI